MSNKFWKLLAIWTVGTISLAMGTNLWVGLGAGLLSVYTSEALNESD